MTRIWRWTVVIVLTLCWTAVTQVHAFDTGKKVKIYGLIVDRTADNLTLKTSAGTVTVVLTDDTKAQKPKGLGLRKAQMSFAALIPGLKVSVEGVSDDQGRVVASTITFSGDDLKTAEAIQAGLNPTQQAVKTSQQDIEANKAQISATQDEVEAVSKRFSDLTEFDTKAELNVLFASGSKNIPAKDKTALMNLAREAVNLTGYIIQVKGFADASGNAEMNQKLSMDRAQEVIAFLIQTCNVPVRRIVAPGAMGMASPVASNETAQGRAQNRRVEIKVLVNRGLAGEQKS